MVVVADGDEDSGAVLYRRRWRRVGVDGFQFGIFRAVVVCEAT